MPEFKPEKLAPKQQFVFEGDWPVSIAFLGDGRVAAGDRGGQIFIWNVDEEDGKKNPAQEKKDDKAKQSNSKYLGLKGSPPVRQLLGHTNEVSQLIALSDGKTLISASLDRTIRIWDTSAKATGSAEVILDIKAREKLSKRDK